MNELFFIALYLLSFSSPLISNTVFKVEDNKIVPPVVLASPASPKPSVFFTSPWSAGAMEMARANKLDSTIPWVMAISSFPIMFLKQIINIIQLVKASKWLAEGDIVERRKQRLQKSS
jgi:CDP-diacylglycerol--inositol 3-phosphatidyltransferase